MKFIATADAAAASSHAEHHQEVGISSDVEVIIFSRNYNDNDNEKNSHHHHYHQNASSVTGAMNEKERWIMSRLNPLNGELINATYYENTSILTIFSKPDWNDVLWIDERDFSLKTSNPHVAPVGILLDRPLYFQFVNRTSQAIIGWRYDPGIVVLHDDKSQQVTASHPPQLLWKKTFTKIVAFASASPSPFDKHIHSKVYITGDNHILEKYLNPTLVAIASVSKAAVEDNDNRELTVYLVDGRNGNVVDSILETQQLLLVNDDDNVNGDGVSLLVDENVVLCQYSTKDGQYVLSVAELFFLTEADDVDGKIGQRTMKKDLIGTAVQVKRQKYLLEAPVKMMSASQTLKGITGKQYYMAFVNGRILSLSKLQVDVRRPMKQQTPAELEELLSEYDPRLPILGPDLLTGNETVLAIRGVRAFPTHLESTCHVVAWGLDIFYTRMAPSQAYDHLSGDFSFALLLLTCGILIIVTFVMRHFAIIRKRA